MKTHLFSVVVLIIKTTLISHVSLPSSPSPFTLFSLDYNHTHLFLIYHNQGLHKGHMHTLKFQEWQPHFNTREFPTLAFCVCETWLVSKTMIIDTVETIAMFWHLLCLVSVFLTKVILQWPKTCFDYVWKAVSQILCCHVHLLGFTANHKGYFDKHDTI